MTDRVAPRAGVRLDEPCEAHAAYRATKVFGSLDGLRAIAILAVVWQHAHGWYNELWLQADHAVSNWQISGRGFLGVDLFFVISGFLIVTLLLREHRDTGTISLRSFYARRSLRIFPAYYLMLLVFVGVAYLKPGSTSQQIREEFIFAALYVSNLVPMPGPLSFTWSLAAEEQFYVMVPTLEKFARRTAPTILAVLYVLVSLPPLGFFPDVAMPEFFRGTTFGPILLGVLLAHALDDPRRYRVVRRLLGHWSSPLFTTLLVVVTCSYQTDDINGWPRLIIHWCLLAMVASCVVRENHALLSTFSFWPVRRIGVVSYGIYLYHPIALYLCYRALRDFEGSSEMLFFSATIISSWLIAELSYRTFEARFLALKHRFARRPGAMVSATSSY